MADDDTTDQNRGSQPAEEYDLRRRFLAGSQPPPEPQQPATQTDPLSPTDPFGFGLKSQPLPRGPFSPQQPPQESPADKQKREEDERHTQANVELAKKFEDYQQRLDPLLSAQERSMKAPLPQVPNLGKVPQPPPQDLGENANKWLIASSVLAGFAGLASRRSSTNALAAFSGALDGFAAGDKMRFDANYQHWKAQSEATIQNNKTEMDAYEAIIKRRDLDQRQRASAMEIEATRFHNEFIRQTAAEAARRGDDATLMVAMDGTQGKMADYVISQQKMVASVDMMMERVRLQQSGAFKPMLDQASIEQRAGRGAIGDLQGMYRDIGVNDPNKVEIDKTLNRIMHEQNPGMSDVEIGKILAERQQQYAGGTTEARATGTRAAGIKLASDQLAGFAELALKASDELPRGTYTSVNEMMQALQKEKGNAAYLKFREYNQSLIKAYAGAMAAGGGGRGGVYYMQQASDMLDTATSANGYRAQVEALFDNVNAELGAVAKRQGQPQPEPIVPPQGRPVAAPPPDTDWQKWIKKWIGSGQFMDLGGGWSAKPAGDEEGSDLAAGALVGGRAIASGVEKGLENIGPAVIGGIVGHMIP